MFQYKSADVSNSQKISRKFTEKLKQKLCKTLKHCVQKRFFFLKNGKIPHYLIQDTNDIEDSVKNVIELNSDFENTNKIEQALGTIHNLRRL